MNYRAQFIGRRIGTDKIVHEIVDYVQAESAIEARKKLSERYQDIQELKLEWPTATQLRLPIVKPIH